MTRKRGIDIRSNWVFYDDSLLTVETMSAEVVAKTKLLPVTPAEFRDIIDQNHDVIHEAGEAFYKETLKTHDYPDAKVSHPWLHVIKLATYADTFRYGLTQEAEALEPRLNANSNNDYPRDMIRKEHYPYLDVIDSSPLVGRVPGRMSGWNLARDGLWLQAKSQQQFDQDASRLTK